MTRRNNPKAVKPEQAETQPETVTPEVVQEINKEVNNVKEIVTAKEGGVEIESKNLSQDQADGLASSLKNAQQNAQAAMILEKQKGAIRQYAFSIYNSMIMAGIAFGSESNRKKFIKLSVETAKDFVKFSKDIDMDGVL